MYRIVASDMDETFLDGRHEIPPANLEALARMRELGVLFVPSSGRGYLSIMDNFADVNPALMEGTYVLSYNGANINRFGDPTPLCESELDHELADELWALGIEHGLGLHAYTPDCHIYVRDLTASEQAYLASLKRIVEYDETNLDEFPVISKLLFMKEDLDWLHEFAENEVRPLLKGRAELTYSSGRYLEVIPAGANKGTGLVKLAQMLGIDVSETIGIGDSANDLEMIEAAGLGVGVANITDDVRPLCDVVLKTRGEDGAFMELVNEVIVPSMGN